MLTILAIFGITVLIAMLIIIPMVIRMERETQRMIKERQEML